MAVIGENSAARAIIVDHPAAKASILRDAPAAASRLVIVLALMLVAGWLRFSATSFGLPDHFRPDEEYMVSRALGFEADWNPHFALYPAAQMYVQHAALKYYARLIGYENFRAAYAGDAQALAYLVARRVSASFGVAAVPAIYFAGAPAFGPGAAIAAAAIMTFATLPVRESKYATTDAPTLFWLTMALAMVLRVARRGRSLDYVGAGLFSGLAIATKYPAGVVLFAIVTAHFGVCRRQRAPWWYYVADPGIFLALGMAAVVTFCATPYVFLDWRQTVVDYTYQRGFVLYGVGNRLADYGWSWLLYHAMPDTLGVALQALVLAAMVWALIRPRPGTLSLLTFLAVALIGLTRSHYVFYRYLMVPLPAMVLLVGLMISDLAQIASRCIGQTRAVGLAAAGTALVLAPCLVRDLQLNHLLRQTDTRTIAREWIEAHIPPGGAIAATDNTTPYGKPQLYTVRVVPMASPQLLKQQGVEYVMSDSMPPLQYYSRGPTPLEQEWLDSQATLVLDLDPLRPGAPMPVFDAADAFYAPLRNITSMTRPGPRIRIWKLK